jgi:hypothetical protein
MDVPRPADRADPPDLADLAEEVASRAVADARHLVDRPGLKRLVELAESVRRGRSS